MKKDYDAMVRAEWQHFDDICKEMLLHEYNKLASAALPLTSFMIEVHPDLMNLFEKVFSKEPAVNKAEIIVVLNGFPSEVIDQVCQSIMPIALDKMWHDGFYSFKFQIMSKMRINLNKTIRLLGSHIKNIEKPYPLIVKEPLIDAFETAKAYKELINDELKNFCFCSDGKTKYSTKHHPLWKAIYSSIAEIILSCPEGYGQQSAYSIVANLMSVAYPWYWGNMDHNKATEHIRKGCTR